MKGIYLSKIKRNINDYGLKKTINKLLLRIFGVIYEKRIYRIYRKELNNISPPKYKISIDNVKFKQIKDNDSVYIKQIEEEAEWLRGELYNKIKDGTYCLSALENENVIGFNIIDFGNVFIPLINYNKIFNKNCAWSEHITVKKDYRRKGIADYLRYYVFLELIDREIKWLYGGCLIDNLPSLNLARKLGFRELADIEYIKKIGFKKWIFKKIKRF